jgi:hypothetical protein
LVKSWTKWKDEEGVPTKETALLLDQQASWTPLDRQLTRARTDNRLVCFAGFLRPIRGLNTPANQHFSAMREHRVVTVRAYLSTFDTISELAARFRLLIVPRDYQT